MSIRRQSLTRATTYRGENLRFVQGSALDLPLGDASVDAVVSFETLEHVREHTRFMAEVKRVLRPGGKLIVSTPERAVYSARGEPVNTYHLHELTVAEFDSLLRANFGHVVILTQRAILGSLIVAAEGGGPWRSYERRSLEYIEASAGLTRAPFLVAIASDKELFMSLLRSTWIDGDPQKLSEVLTIAGVPIASSRDERRDQAAERGSGDARLEAAEIKRLTDAAATREAQAQALTEVVRSIKQEFFKVERQRDQLQSLLSVGRQKTDKFGRSPMKTMLRRSRASSGVNMTAAYLTS